MSKNFISNMTQGSPSNHSNTTCYKPIWGNYCCSLNSSCKRDVKIPMVMGVSEVLCRVIFANVLIMIPAIEYMGIWWATGLNWLVTGGIGCIRYATGRWKNKSIVPENAAVL